jgi:hypothetical protein
LAVAEGAVRKAQGICGTAIGRHWVASILQQTP